MGLPGAALPQLASVRCQVFDLLSAPPLLHRLRLWTVHPTAFASWGTLWEMPLMGPGLRPTVGFWSRKPQLPWGTAGTARTWRP